MGIDWETSNSRPPASLQIPSPLSQTKASEDLHQNPERKSPGKRTKFLQLLASPLEKMAQGSQRSDPVANDLGDRQHWHR
jgi:hypothetical protein